MTRTSPPKRPATRRASSGAARPSKRVAAAKPYHHGDLRRVLVDAAFELVTEGGAEAVSVREAARRAGVSPGAPFRHFPSRDALLAAVAEEAQRRFRAEISAALADVPEQDPLARYRALGRAYLRWALRNPAHFEVISTGRLFDYEAAGELRADNAEIIATTARVLEEAGARGLLRTRDVRVLQIAGRALVYGFARMKTDGHFPRWGVADDEVELLADKVLDLFLAGIATES
ncbi:TetR/AcrR family transcriptional regulator [Bradyrhizobium prioriisuperbiae]|uniref:TetR/AcrR family transcriptional regulator n=1 Tax=Bradyrhizobium prioriisuperbiae TaxID=2854389 RepID=UPI0028E9CF1C|nr:TetR/AcrR family transcriptional regulator [Bradyrhizobium prioritasuperba]